MDARFPQYESRSHFVPGVAMALLVMVLLALPATATQAANWTFQLKFTEEVHPKPFTGRVYLIFSRRLAEPRHGPSWFHPEQFLSVYVKGWKPGEVLTVSAAHPETMLGYPVPLNEMNLGGIRAQAVVRFNPWHREIGEAPGNGFSQAITLPAQPDQTNPPLFEIGKTVPETVFQETRWCKLLKVRSDLLSAFHGRDVYLNAAVILPASYYDKPEKRYPVIYTIPGFGGTHQDVQGSGPVRESNRGGVEFLRVTLDPSCPLGHHVFANSANNGPVGDALITELIPALDKQFRTVAEPTARFLTGHSSGGWSSLWLQVAYPEFFGGVWSTAPDPVDFRDFQRINIYRQGENMYQDPQGNPRPLARSGGRVLLWYEGFASMEWVLGHGGQLHSFEAVFSPRGEDGQPLLLWDRKTGAINPAVAEAWKKYDISLILAKNWETLGPKLKGKLHVFMGDQDTFYLEGATRLLKERLAEVGSDAVVEMHPGHDHSTLYNPQLLSRIRSQMVEAYLKYHPATVRE